DQVFAAGDGADHDGSPGGVRKRCTGRGAAGFSRPFRTDGVPRGKPSPWIANPVPNGAAGQGGGALPAAQTRPAPAPPPGAPPAGTARGPDAEAGRRVSTPVKAA